MDYAILKIPAFQRRSFLAAPTALALLCGPLLAAFALLQADPAAAAGSSMAPKTVAQNHAMNRRRNAAERRRENNLRSFESRDGVPTLTNRGNKYPKKEGYTEVKIDLHPIFIPAEWRKAKKSSRNFGSDEIRKIVSYYSGHYNLDENLVNAVITVESNWNPNAMSTAGACGLMQLMPGTADDMGVSDIFDPTENISGGTQYLSKMMEMFDDDTTLALAAYNAGPGNVLKHGGVPPFQETQDYVVRVQSLAGGKVGPQYYRSPFSKKNSLGTVRGGYATARSSIADPPAPRPAPAHPADGASLFQIQFHSGLIQPADKVEDNDPYYFIQYKRRSYSVRKDLVKEIVKRSA